MRFAPARWLLPAVLALGWLAPAHAGPTLTVVGPADPNLVVGQQVSFVVRLSGLIPGETIDFLAATVGFDPTLFGSPAITPGLIIPDPAGFTSATFPNAADGFYDNLLTGGPPINADGPFFRVDLTVLRAGTGVVGFTFTDAAGTDTNDNPIAGAAPGAPFTVSATGSGTSAAVPEPATLALLAAGAAVLPLARRRK